MSVLSSLGQAVDSWAHLYSRSKVVSSGVTFIHLGGVLLGGGFEIASDRMTLRIRSPDDAGFRENLREIHAIHRPVIVGLTLAFLSGLLMSAADIDVYLPEPLYWAKMATIALLITNGVRLRVTETRLRQDNLAPSTGWNRLRRSAWVSILLWFGALFFGTALLAI
jgi:hypothetical protein